MKRFSLTLIAVGLIGLIGLMVVGCGQSVPQVSTTSSQPKGLTIRGIVFGQNQSGKQAQPLAGAILYLAGDKVNKTTVSDADGQYSFTDLPSNNTGSSSGGYTIIATREGYQRTIYANLKFGSDSAAPVPDNSVMTEDIIMINNPVVLEISPYPGATIEAGVNTITIQFNEAMDASSVRPRISSWGLRTFAIADTQTLTTTWSADSKTLYVTTGALYPNLFYCFRVDDNTTAKDLAGNLLDTTGSGSGWGAGGLSVTVYNNTWEANNYNYRTASGGAPGAPTGVLLTVNTATVIDYSDVSTAGNPVDLSWLAPASGLVTGYKVYVGASSSGPWEWLYETNLGQNTTTANTFHSTVIRVNDALYGTGTTSLPNADCIKQLAFVTTPVYFKVVAFNGEGETAATAVATRDATKPTLTLLTSADRNAANVGVPAALAAALTDFSAGASLNLGCYVVFSEPMIVGTLTDPTKYTVDTGQTVTGATVVYNSGGTCVVQLTFGTAIAPVTSQVTVLTTGPADLSGNVMNSTNNVARID